MSTADHAGRPVRPPAAGRAPYAEGGNAQVGGTTGGSGSSALRRLAESDGGRPAPATASSSDSGSSATRPVPVQREQSSASAGSKTTLPTYPEGHPSRTEPLPTYPEGRSSRQDDTQNGRRSAGAPTPTPTPTRRSGDTPAPVRPAPARRVRLTVSRVDPWSAMKISFLLSVALGIAGVVMVAVLWTVLEGMGVFDQVNGVIGQVIQDGSQKFDILDFIGFTRVVSLSIVVGVVDVILITALATLGAFLYNVSSALVGGLQLTLTDD